MAGPVPSVKEPHLAGRWYPAAPAALARRVEELLAAGGSPRPGVVAVVVPHAAYEYSGPTAARAFAAAGAGVRRAIVLAPSHFAGFRGAALLPMRGYRTPLGVVPIDAEATAALAAALRSLLEPGTLLVASSDLTHYGRRFDYLPVPPTDASAVAAAVRRLDEGALERIVARDADGFAAYVERTGATICGRHPIEVLLRALPAGARGERLAYTTSLEVSGDYEHTVSYAAVAFALAA